MKYFLFYFRLQQLKYLIVKLLRDLVCLKNKKHPQIPSLNNQNQAGYFNHHQIDSKFNQPKIILVILVREHRNQEQVAVLNQSSQQTLYLLLIRKKIKLKFSRSSKLQKMHNQLQKKLYRIVISEELEFIINQNQRQTYCVEKNQVKAQKIFHQSKNSNRLAKIKFLNQNQLQRNKLHKNNNLLSLKKLNNLLVLKRWERTYLLYQIFSKSMARIRNSCAEIMKR